MGDQVSLHLFMPVGSSLLALLIEYDSLASWMLSLFELISSNGMIWKFSMECLVSEKVSDMAVG